LKVLFIRFSSIGDIVLTFPVVRCTKDQLENVEIHYLTKSHFADLLNACPEIDKVHTLEHSLWETSKKLKAEKFDFIIDLHHNLRTSILLLFLQKPNFRFHKLNFQKWLLTQFKINRLPKNLHVVERYFGAVKKLGVRNDNCNNAFFIPEHAATNAHSFLPNHPFIAFAIGAQFTTKRLPTEQLINLIQKLNLPIVLLGGKEDSNRGKEITGALNAQNIIDLCGKTTLFESAYLVSKAKALLTHDTGMMHIAACFDVPILTIWGNTIKDFGMSAYRPESNDTLFHFEVENLSCRPCSKIGSSQCPKKHFACMKKQDLTKIAETTHKLIEVKN
jgi:ADP-heptose:LPS heptosyltransferase